MTMRVKFRYNISHKEKKTARRGNKLHAEKKVNDDKFIDRVYITSVTNCRKWPCDGVAGDKNGRTHDVHVNTIENACTSDTGYI